MISNAATVRRPDDASLEFNVDFDFPKRGAASSVALCMSDEKLMLAYVRGDVSAFDKLFEKHKGGVYRYFLRLCGSREDAEELTQEIWFSVIKSRHIYQPKSKFTSWLYTIAHNRLIDHYRSKSRGVPLSYGDGLLLDELADNKQEEPTVKVERSRQINDLMDAIEHLPEAQREAFLMREEGNMSLDEIADATHVSRETAKSRLRYAVQKLRNSVRKS